MISKKCIICVDGGGTKTEVVAYTLSGEEVSHHIGGSCNFSYDIKQAIENLLLSIEFVYDHVKDLYQCE